MDYKFYLISIFENDDALNRREWNNIEDFVQKFGWELIDDYLAVEKKFLAFIKMFFRKFSLQSIQDYGSNHLASTVIIYEEELISGEQHHALPCYYGLENVNQRLEQISKLNIAYLDDNDLNFLITCWLRNLCLVFFFDIAHTAYLKATDADLCFVLMIHDNWNISEIFQHIDGIYFLEIMDPNQ